MTNPGLVIRDDTTSDRRDRSDRGTVVVLGGYGSVGRAVAHTLAEWFPGDVVVAGRDGARADALASSSGGAITARQVDATKPDDVRRVLEGARVVVMCIEQANKAVARACLERGIHYVDVSASDDLLSAIAQLDPLAREHAATAVLSVGLAPGLTNLLARRAYERLPSATRIDITLLAGVNGDHGPDALRWIIDNLSAPPAGGDGAGLRAVRVDLPGFGTRTAHPFPFSDQYAVTRALGVQATTRLAFESAILTAVIFGLRSMRVFQLLRRPRARRLLTAMLARTRFGSDRFVAQASATDAAGAHVAFAAAGRQEGRATGVVAAHVARLLREGDVPAGVVHIDDLGDTAVLVHQLEQHGITLREAHRPVPVGGPHGRSPGPYDRLDQDR